MSKEEFKIDLTGHGEVTMNELAGIIHSSLSEMENSKHCATSAHLDVFSACVKLLTSELSGIMIRSALSNDKFEVVMDRRIVDMLALDMKTQVSKIIDNFNGVMSGVTSREQFLTRMKSLRSTMDSKEYARNENVH